MKLIIYTDGGARGNPGPAAFGFVIYHGHEKVKEYKKCIGIGTNNQAEYMAVISALEIAKDIGGSDLVIFSDSQLMIRQITGQYKVRNKELLMMWKKVKALEKNYSLIRFQHVKRENPGIARADRLVNEALDGL